MSQLSWGRVIDAVLTRPQSARTRRRARTGRDEVRFTGIRPNAPRMITVVASLVATVVGLVVTNTITITWINERLEDANVHLDATDGWLLLLASPLLLVAGSLLAGL